jgi:23S rRNA (pseudouridine1915-N3)-methyltransferase
MNITVVAVGQRVPLWAQQAWDDYAKRFPGDFRIQLKALKTEPRASRTVEQIWALEAERIEAAIPKDSIRVTLDERGARWGTQALAQHIQEWQLESRHLTWIIGGPDGLAPHLRPPNVTSVRLSDMTLPHQMVRVMLIEQLYRAWSILNHHPYHRE